MKVFTLFRSRVNLERADVYPMPPDLMWGKAEPSCRSVRLALELTIPSTISQDAYSSHKHQDHPQGTQALISQSICKNIDETPNCETIDLLAFSASDKDS
jgi:hypothetical protein